jgi:SAM-dependent methyltransferase
VRRCDHEHGPDVRPRARRGPQRLSFSARRPAVSAGLDAESRRKIVATYEKSLRRHGPTVRALKWADAKGQRERFRLIAGVGPWDGVSVADVGCGLGDLFGFLRDERHEVRYTGYDLSRRMVAAARQRYRSRQAHFEVRDVLAAGFGGRFDYVVASGTFNLRIRDHDRFLRRMLAAMYGACRRAIAFNIFHPYDDPRWTAVVEWAGYYCVPRQTVVGWCRRLSPVIEVGPGVGEEESTLFVRRP